MSAFRIFLVVMGLALVVYADEVVQESQELAAAAKADKKELATDLAEKEDDKKDDDKKEDDKKEDKEEEDDKKDDDKKEDDKKEDKEEEEKKKEEEEKKKEEKKEEEEKKKAEKEHEEYEKRLRAALPEHTICDQICPGCTFPSCNCENACWPGTSLEDTPDKACNCFCETPFCEPGEEPQIGPDDECASCWPRENKACMCINPIGFCGAGAGQPGVEFETVMESYKRTKAEKLAAEASHANVAGIGLLCLVGFLGVAVMKTYRQRASAGSERLLDSEEGNYVQVSN